jgi:hypothetical protein
MTPAPLAATSLVAALETAIYQVISVPRRSVADRWMPSVCRPDAPHRHVHAKGRPHPAGDLAVSPGWSPRLACRGRRRTTSQTIAVIPLPTSSAATSR